MEAIIMESFDCKLITFMFATSEPASGSIEDKSKIQNWLSNNLVS